MANVTLVCNNSSEIYIRKLIGLTPGLDPTNKKSVI